MKNKKLLVSGLKKIKEIKESINNVAVRTNSINCDELVQIFDLESSIISAEATIIAALNRKESRGSHQRSDYPGLNTSEKINYYLKLNKQTLDLDIQKKNISPLSNIHQSIINKGNNIGDLKGRLLE